jgi:outer membrane lipoprotein-sorting protein
MTVSYQRVNNGWCGFAMLLFPISLLFLAGCGSSTPAHTSWARLNAQELLANVAQNLNTANTLHGIFDLSITGRTFHESSRVEIWTEVPSKNRAVLLQSPLASFSTGAVTVADGSQSWLYDPIENIAYTGSVPTPSPSTQAAPSVAGSASYSDVFFAPLHLLQYAFTNSNATLDSPSATANGHAAYALDIESKPDIQGVQFYAEVYIDKATGLPVQVIFDTLNDNAGNDVEEVVNIPLLTLNVYLPDSIFSFTPPEGSKVLPWPSSGNSPLTLDQAQQRAGYHLLVIPSSSTKYVLQHVEVLGSTGHEIYQLDYASGSTTFAIKESQVLANDSSYSGARVSVRGTIGTILTTRGGVSTLFWTEKGVGIVITGSLSQWHALVIAELLA